MKSCRSQYEKIGSSSSTHIPTRTDTRTDTQPQHQVVTQGGVTLNQTEKNTNNITQVYEAQSVKRRRINDQPDDVDQLFNNGESSSSEQGLPVAFLRGTPGISVIPTSSHYIVNQLDNTHVCNVTLNFQEFQRHAIEVAQNTGFILETNIELLLSLSSILLVKPGQYSDDLLEYFKEEELDGIHNNVLTRLAGDKYDEIKFDKITKEKVEHVFDKLLKRNGDRIVAVGELAQLLSKSNQHETKLILALMSLVQKLPPYPLKSPLGEIELCCQYLDPILFSLFNDYKQKVNFRWPNLTLRDEAANTNPSSRRPDATMTMLTQNTFGENRGYGEAKTSQNNSNYDLTRDLVRINTFSKQSIDLADMQAVIGFQAVGNHVTFSVLVLANDGVYVACDIASMDFPRSLDEVKVFLPMLDKLMLVLSIYDKCLPSPNHTTSVEWKRETLNSPTFKTYVHTTRSNKSMTRLSFS
jgi:hypothetical protein